MNSMVTCLQFMGFPGSRASAHVINEVDAMSTSLHYDLRVICYQQLHIDISNHCLLLQRICDGCDLNYSDRVYDSLLAIERQENAILDI